MEARCPLNHESARPVLRAENPLPRVLYLFYEPLVLEMETIHQLESWPSLRQSLSPDGASSPLGLGWVVT